MSPGRAPDRFTANPRRISPITVMLMATLSALSRVAAGQPHPEHLRSVAHAPQKPVEPLSGAADRQSQRQQKQPRRRAHGRQVARGPHQRFVPHRIRRIALRPEMDAVQKCVATQNPLAARARRADGRVVADPEAQTFPPGRASAWTARPSQPSRSTGPLYPSLCANLYPRFARRDTACPSVQLWSFLPIR